MRLKHYFGFKTTLLLATISIAGCTTEQKVAENTAVEAKASAASQIQANSIGKYKAYTQKFTGNTTITQNHATGHVGNLFFTHRKDSGAASLTMSTDGSSA